MLFYVITTELRIVRAYDWSGTGRENIIYSY